MLHLCDSKGTPYELPGSHGQTGHGLDNHPRNFQYDYFEIDEAAYMIMMIVNPKPDTMPIDLEPFFALIDVQTPDVSTMTDVTGVIDVRVVTNINQDEIPEDMPVNPYDFDIEEWWGFETKDHEEVDLHNVILPKKGAKRNLLAFDTDALVGTLAGVDPPLGEQPVQEKNA